MIGALSIEVIVFPVKRQVMQISRTRTSCRTCRLKFILNRNDYIEYLLNDIISETFADMIVGAMCPTRLTQWISLLCGTLNKELKLRGSVQAFYNHCFSFFII